jgi:PAS domain S-box-containing protein
MTTHAVKSSTGSAGNGRRQSAISDSENDAVILTDDKARVSFWNMAAERMFGYENVEVTGKKLSELVIPQSLLKHVQGVLGRVTKTGQEMPRGVKIETTVLRKNGTAFPAELSISGLQIKGSLYALCTVREITEQREKEKALRDSEEKYRVFAHELKGMEKELFENRTKLQNILAASSDAITITDLDGNITECNQTTLDLYGCSSKEELVGKSGFALIAKKDRIVTIENVQKALRQVPAPKLEYTILSKDGHEFAAELSLRVLKDQSGKPNGFVAITKDITPRKEMEKKLEDYSRHLEQLFEERAGWLKEAQEQLLKSERLAAIGELATMVGHDLRNPLQSMRNATSYLKISSGAKCSDEMKEMFEIIEKNIEYSNKIVNDLLDYSREIRLELTETTPKQMIMEAMSLVKVPENIRVLDTTRNEPKMTVDVQKLERVFINMIKNAFDAMPQGGTLTVRSREAEGNLEFAFSDTGMGMPKETLQKICTPLFTTKAKGMCFGLPICKRIVEAHRGAIRAESTVGKGSTFTIMIPITPEKADRSEQVSVKLGEHPFTAHGRNQD